MGLLDNKIVDGLKDTAIKVKDTAGVKAKETATKVKDIAAIKAKETADKVKDNAIVAKDKLVDKINELEARELEEAEEEPTFYKYEIRDIYNYIKCGFKVLNEEGQELYLIKQEKDKYYSKSITLFDINENEIGRAERNQVSYLVTDFVFYYQNEIYDVVRENQSFKKNVYEFRNSGWRMESDFIRSCFTVYDKSDNIVIKIVLFQTCKRRLFGDLERHVYNYELEILSEKYEIIGIFLVMMIQSCNKVGWYHEMHGG